jgi:anti-anti-sigma factor
MKSKSSEDGNKWKVTTITYHGRLVSDNADQIKELVRPLISEGGHIVIDFADLKYLDSLGLGSLGWAEGVSDQQRHVQAGIRSTCRPVCASC